MASFGTQSIPLAPNTRYESSTKSIPPVEDPKDSTTIPGLSVNDSNSHSISSETDNEKPKTAGLQYAPIHGAAGYDGNETMLQKTVTQLYGPLSPVERDEIRQIASLHRSKTGVSTKTDNELDRTDTIDEMSDDDPRVDPEKPEFDVSLWARAFVRAMDEEGIRKSRAGFAFKDLNVSGTGSALSLQSDVASILMAPFRLNEYVQFGHKPHKMIIQNFDGVVKSGEMLIVLGRPGSGCSTFLKTICGELTGLELEKGSTVHYNGIPQERMVKEFKGEVTYNQEVDKHFPHLTVGETLEFAAAARTPHSRVRGISRGTFIKHMVKVVMTVFGLSHTRNTKVGNEYIRGVSGGERKVTILFNLSEGLVLISNHQIASQYS